MKIERPRLIVEGTGDAVIAAEEDHPLDSTVIGGAVEPTGGRMDRGSQVGPCVRLEIIGPGPVAPLRTPVVAAEDDYPVGAGVVDHRHVDRGGGSGPRVHVGPIGSAHRGGVSAGDGRNPGGDRWPGNEEQEGKEYDGRRPAQERRDGLPPTMGWGSSYLSPWEEAHFSKGFRLSSWRSGRPASRRGNNSQIKRGTSAGRSGGTRARRCRRTPEAASRFQHAERREDVRDRFPVRGPRRLGPAGRSPGRQLRDDGGDPARRAGSHLRDDEGGHAHPHDRGVGGRDPLRPGGHRQNVFRRDGDEALAPAGEVDRGTPAEGEGVPDLGRSTPEMRDRLDDPSTDPLVDVRAAAHILDQKGEANPDDRASEDVGRPVQTEVDAAEPRQDGRDARRDAHLPTEADRQEGGDREGARRVAAREGRIELGGAPVAREGADVREGVARSRAAHEILDRLGDEDRNPEDEEDIEGRLAQALQPERHRDEEDHVDAGEDREEDEDPIEDRVRAREIQGPENRLVEPAGGKRDEGVHAPPMPMFPIKGREGEKPSWPPRASSSALDREREIYHRLLRHYGPQHWWPADSPFEVIVGALLMQQTSWRNVAEAIRNLEEAGLLDVRELDPAPNAR